MTDSNPDHDLAATRRRIAAEHGMAPEDAALFLASIDDEDRMRAVATRLAEIDVAEQLDRRNVVPKEGAIPPPPYGDESMGEFLAELFNPANWLYN